MTEKILFIAPYPFDEAPSQRFRFEQYLPWLEEKGFETEVMSFLDKRGWRTLYEEGSFFKKMLAMNRAFFRRWSLMFRIRKYDHIFIHREASMIGPPVFEWIIAKVLKRKYIYDFDDAIWLPNYSESNARFHKLKMYGKVRKIIKWADKVTAGNNFLADYARQFNRDVILIPTTVDTVNTHNLTGDPENKIPVLGWTGSHTTASYLKDLLPVLDTLYREQAFIFRVVSNQEPALNRPYVDFVKWTRNEEIEVLSTFNIGLMPLRDSVWAKGKCGFKLLQYMALRIPAVASPVGANTTIIRHGADGFLCETEEDWIKTLLELIRKKELRKTFGEAGRHTVENHFSVNRYKSTYLSLFE